MNETRILRCLINKAGGNSGAGSKTYRTTLPATWVKELGVSEHDRELELTFVRPLNSRIDGRKYPWYNKK